MITPPRRARSLVSTLLMLLLATVSVAQEGGEELSEKERRKQAKKEQAELKAKKEAEERGAEEAKEAEAEQARLDELGAAGAGSSLEENKGFFFRLEAFFVEASGADRDIARVGTISTTATSAEDLDTDANGLADAFSVTDSRPVTLTYDSQVSPRLELGWRLGHGGAVSLRYWNYSESASLDIGAAEAEQTFASSAGGNPIILGTIDNLGRENTPSAPNEAPEAFDRVFGSPKIHVDRRYHGASSLSADGDLDVSRIDLLYSKTGLARPRFELQYVAGLTMASLERRESAVFTWRSLDQALVGLDAQSIEVVEAADEVSALGPTVGIGGRYRLGDGNRWKLRFSLEAAGLQADHDLSFSDVDNYTQSNLPDIPPEVFQDKTSDESDELLTVFEGEVGIEGRVGERMRFSAGYRHGEWLSALVEERFPGAINTSTLSQRSVDLTFSGPWVRFGFYF